jgi:hypothetical protein
MPMIHARGALKSSDFLSEGVVIRMAYLKGRFLLWAEHYVRRDG